MTTDKTQDLLDELHAGVEALVSGDDWQRALDQASRFHTYSFGNVMLIAMQAPEATRVAGYKTWQSLGRQVRKGERSIRILAPTLVKRTDEETGETARVLVGFRGVGVFDLAQTDGDPVAELPTAELLGGEAPAGAVAKLVSAIEAEGFAVSFVSPADLGSANGMTDFGSKTVRVRDDVAPAQAVRTLAHELAHVMLDAVEAERLLGCRGRSEVRAESVAYVIARSLGLDAGGYSFPYVGGWADGDTKVVQSVGEQVLRVAKTILAAIEADDAVAA